jgi:hypothetical protein
MSCGETPIFIYAGSTWNEPSFGAIDDETEVPIPLTGLQARGKLKDLDGNIVAVLDSFGVIPPSLTVDEAAGTVTPNVGSDATPDYLVDNVQRSLKLYLELYDFATPPTITPFGEYDIIVKPDNI